MADDILIEISEENLLIELNEKGDPGTSNIEMNDPFTGAINGVNRIFTLSRTPATGSVYVTVNGLRQIPASFVLAVNVVTFAADAIPLTGDIIEFMYQY